VQQHIQGEAKYVTHVCAGIVLHELELELNESAANFQCTKAFVKASN